jgi:hypothetical protein
MPSRNPSLAAAVLLAATLVPVAPAAAQDAGFALELAPSNDTWIGVRSTLHLFGDTVEPAAGYVRGCPGHVGPETAGAQIEVLAGFDPLTFTVSDDSVEAIVVGTPDGLFRCVRRGADGLIAARFNSAEAGRYRVWAAVPEGGRIATRLIVADRAISALELRGLDMAALGAPRAGRHDFTAEVPRQRLVSAGALVAQEAMGPLDPSGYCPGYGRFDAPDAILALPQDSRNLALFARSDVDLTIAVRSPDGRWLCNDDSFNLDPAVIFDSAPAGDYHIWVGAFSQGREGLYDLFAGLGAPSWDGSVFAPGAPRLGTVTVDPATASRGAQLVAQGQVLATDPMSSLPIPDFCPGYTGTSAPDAIVRLERPEDLLSLFATSGTDLVMAVRTPQGMWFCNDDTAGLDPAVTVYGAIAGDYLVWIGAFGQGMTGAFTLMATLGEPNWGATGERGSAGALDPAADPAVARIGFGPRMPIDPRLIFDIAPSQIEARGLGEGCVGFLTPSQPDVVIAAEAGLPQLMVYMVSEADGVLLVVAPDGTVHCNDDFDGLNPGVMIPNPEPGDWAVFAGTYGGQGGIATLGVTIANPLWVMDREH